MPKDHRTDAMSSNLRDLPLTDLYSRLATNNKLLSDPTLSVTMIDAVSQNYARYFEELLCRLTSSGRIDPNHPVFGKVPEHPSSATRR